MSYSVPEMPLSAGIWSVNAAGTVTLRELTVCNVSVGKSAKTPGFGVISPSPLFVFYLLFPPGTDLRDVFSEGQEATDLVETPSGSGRWYEVLVVQDLGQGFPNEHRCAVAGKDTSVELWPAPLPPVFGEAPARVRRVGDQLAVARPRATVRG